MTLDPGHLTEFYAGFNGTCGECALEECLAAADGRRASEDEMVALTHEMQAHGAASANGASTLKALADEARRRGYEVLLEWDYQEPLQGDWHQQLLDNAGVNPILIQHAKGRNLRDVETGAADEPGLDYHFTSVLNKQADGYVDNDGDNPQVLSRYQVYNYQTFINSVPCGLLIIKKKETKVATTFNTAGLGEGFAAVADADVAIAETYEDAGAWSWCMLANGRIFFYDKESGVKTDAAAAVEVVKRLAAKAHATVPAPVPAGIPASLKSDMATALNALAPLMALGVALQDALK